MKQDSPAAHSGGGPTGSAAAARIRAAATTAFAQQGYGATSTRDITRRLGLSAAAMYPHYESKEALLYAISLEGHQAALRELRQADDLTRAPTDRLRCVVAAFACWQANQSSLARVVQYEIRSLTTEHYREIIGIRRTTSAVIAAIIADGLKTGEFRTHDPEGVVLAISSLCVDVCRWFPSGPFQEASRVAELYADIAVRIVS